MDWRLLINVTLLANLFIFYLALIFAPYELRPDSRHIDRITYRAKRITAGATLPLLVLSLALVSI